MAGWEKGHDGIRKSNHHRKFEDFPAWLLTVLRHDLDVACRHENVSEVLLHGSYVTGEPLLGKSACVRFNLIYANRFAEGMKTITTLLSVISTMRVHIYEILEFHCYAIFFIRNASGFAGE
jgi:hypothetical protein